MKTDAAATPGVLLRLTAAGGAAATGAVVASAALGLTNAHWGIAGVALPLLAATTILARLAYPALLVRAASALFLLLRAIAVGRVVAWGRGAGSGRWVH